MSIILNKLSTLKVISESKLNQYIQFCSEHNQNERIKGKTSYHHILPKALFKQFKNLKENEWNGTHLLYSDHYYAHWLFTEAISDYGQLSAFCAMHKKDIKNGRITESELIPAEEFQKKMELRGINYSEWSHIVNKETGLSNAQEGSRKAVITGSKINPKTGLNSYEVGGKKQSITKNTINPETGLSIAKEIGIKTSLTRNIINPETGLNSYEEGSRKAVKTGSKINPKTGLSSYEEGSRKAVIAKRKKTSKYDVYHIDGTKMLSNIIKCEFPVQGLKNSSKEKYLGKSKCGKTKLKNNGNEKWIGCYIVKLNKMNT